MLGAQTPPITKKQISKPVAACRKLVAACVKRQYNRPIAEQILDVKIKREAFTENRIVVVQIVFRNAGEEASPLPRPHLRKKQFSKPVTSCGKSHYNRPIAD